MILLVWPEKETTKTCALFNIWLFFIYFILFFCRMDQNENISQQDADPEHAQAEM